MAYAPHEHNVPTAPENFIHLTRGYSSVGRALGSHSRGQGFDSPYLHHELWEYHHDTPSFLIVSFVLYFLKDKSEFENHDFISGYCPS